jgi:DnaJ-class molecular chaperone
MRSPYAVLGVPKSAESSTIKSAFRSLAKTWHPDQNRDDPLAGSRFAEITHAYQILMDPEMRQRFDRGDIDSRGRKRQPPEAANDPFAAFRNAWRKRPHAAEPGGAYDDLAGFDAMIKHIFGDQADASQCAQAGEAARSADPLAALDELFAKWKNIHRAKPDPAPEPAPAPPRREPVDNRQILELDLEKVLSGGMADIRLTDGTTSQLHIPSGIGDGTEIRHEDPRDRSRVTVVTVRYRPHPGFRPQGRDLHMDHAIELSEAVLGGHVVVQTLDGPARVSLGAWTTGGTPAVVDGKGLPGPDGVRGDLLVHFRIRLPGKPDPQLVDMMRSKRKSFFV